MENYSTFDYIWQVLGRILIIISPIVLLGQGVGIMMFVGLGLFMIFPCLSFGFVINMMQQKHDKPNFSQFCTRLHLAGLINALLWAALMLAILPDQMGLFMTFSIKPFYILPSIIVGQLAILWVNKGSEMMKSVKEEMAGK